jgi:hypothetical protein
MQCDQCFSSAYAHNSVHLLLQLLVCLLLLQRMAYTAFMLRCYMLVHAIATLAGHLKAKTRKVSA